MQKIQKIIGKNKTTQRFISALLIIAILAPAVSAVLFSNPKQTNAQIGCGNTPANPCFTVQQQDAAPVSWLTKFFTGSTSVSTALSASFDAKQWAEVILRHILQAVARRLLAKMTEATVNWINTGFHGAPLFLERPESFFEDIVKYEIKSLVNTVGYDSNRYPYGKAFALNVIQSYKSTFETNAQYSLSKVINDPVYLNNYRNNFEVGGWNGFLLNTQYPQNNYIGSQMVYGNELARVLDGNPVENNISKTQDTLQKGMGFLSPQTCPDNGGNNEYNKVMANQFQRPTFKCSIKEIGDSCESMPHGTEAEKLAYRTCVQKLLDEKDKACNQEKTEWAKKNVCKSELVSTTPGSVVANQIMKAMTSGTFDQTSLAAAMGNSLAVIFDTLLNKFLSIGLNALTSRSNPPAPADDFDFYGQTLGSPSDSGTGSGEGFDWGGPDQVIILADFKRDVQNLLDNANRELKLIDSSDPNAPGIIQAFEQIFQKTQELDMCVPGPNIGWQERMDTEVQRAGGELQVKAADPDPAKASAATEAFNELSLAAASFKEWMGNKINSELANSAEYLNAVNSVKNTSDQNNEIMTRKNVINETLIKVESIKRQLDAITTQPAQGSEEESTMIRLKQRLDGMLIDLSTNSTVTEMQNNLDDAKDKSTNLDRLVTQCTAERTGKGWSVPGGETSSFSTKTEKGVFCASPIVGGYSHGSFVNRGTVTHPEIPLVNATNVYPDSSGIIDAQIDITVSCDPIYRTVIADYKKSNPVP